VSTARPTTGTWLAAATFSPVSVKNESFTPVQIFGMPIFAEALPLEPKRT
jgi:hypothetical protein